MKEINLNINGYEVDWETAVHISTIIAQQQNPDSMIIARYNRLTNACSPCCLKGDVGGRPGWEVYGENHGGSLKIIVNDGDFIFIFN